MGNGQVLAEKCLSWTPNKWAKLMLYGSPQMLKLSPNDAPERQGHPAVMGGHPKILLFNSYVPGGPHKGSFRGT